MFEVVAVEEVVGVEGDEASVWVNDVDTSFLDTADIKSMSVEKLHNDDAEDVFVSDVICNEHFGKAAQQFPRPCADPPPPSLRNASCRGGCSAGLAPCKPGETICPDV